MTHPTFSRLEQIFHRAAELEAEDREAFLTDEAERHPDLAAKARDLLRADALLADKKTVRAAAASITGQRVSPGTKIGPFTIRRLLGQGGMGSVYLGDRVEGDIEQQVAIKLIHGPWVDNTARYRFRLESQVLARLEHPGISRWIDSGETDDGFPYLAMEYISGEPITSYCEAKRATVAETLRLFLRACQAVSYAHRSLIVHRDLKPDHVLVTEDGDVRLVDFGIAKPLTHRFGRVQVEETATQARMYSPRYAAPEQILGRAGTVATDIYALGVMLYELLTATLPFDGGSARQVEDLVLAGHPEAPSRRVTRRDDQASHKLAGRLRGDLDSLVLKCLQREPRERYASVAELIADVDRFLVHRPVLARQGRLAYRLGKFGRRHRLPLAAALAVLSVVVTGLAVFFAQAAETRRQRDRAQEVTDFMVSAFQAADPSHSLGAEVTAAQIVEQSLRQLDVQPPVAPETAAELLLAIGQVQANLGLGSDAWSTLQRAEEAYRVAGRDPELETRIAKAQLRARLDEGRAEAARGVANRLLNRDDLTAEDRLYFELGLAASDFQDSHFERARERYEILNRRAQRVGLGETEIGLKVFKGLGRCLEALGELDQALATYETVLETEDRLLPAVHPQRLDTLHAVETVLMRLSQPHETQKVATEILQLTTKLYGGESLPRARALKTLADVASDLGDPEQAAEHMQAALTIYRRRYGETHKDVAGAWFNLALYAYEAPNLAELADRSFASAITVGSDVWPQDHRNLMLFPIAYSLHLNETGRFDETLVQIRRSLAIADARPEYKEYDFYPFGELARAVAELNLSPSPVGKIDVETWLAECATLPEPQRTMAKKQARLVESLGVEVPPEILAAPDP